MSLFKMPANANANPTDFILTQNQNDVYQKPKDAAVYAREISL